MSMTILKPKTVSTSSAFHKMIYLLDDHVVKNLGLELSECLFESQNRKDVGINTEIILGRAVRESNHQSY